MLDAVGKMDMDNEAVIVTDEHKPLLQYPSYAPCDSLFSKI